MPRDTRDVTDVSGDTDRRASVRADVWQAVHLLSRAICDLGAQEGLAAAHVAHGAVSSLHEALCLVHAQIERVAANEELAQAIAAENPRLIATKTLRAGAAKAAAARVLVGETAR